MDLDLAAVDRILTRVGEDAANIKRDILLHDLKCVAEYFPSVRMLRQAPAERQRKKAKIVEAAKRLKLLLSDKSYDSALNNFRYNYLDKDQKLRPDDLDHLLDRLIERTSAKPRPGDFNFLAIGSPIEWLVGVNLSQLFEQHFQMKASITQVPDEGIYKGAFLEFAEAVIDELHITNNNGEPYSRATIAAALWQGSKKAKGVRVIFARPLDEKPGPPPELIKFSRKTARGKRNP